MRKCRLIKQSKLLKIKSKILLNLFNEKYGFKLGEFNNTTATERVNIEYKSKRLARMFFCLKLKLNSFTAS